MTTQDGSRGNDARRRRRLMQRRTVSGQPCKVPACAGKALLDEEGFLTDCCLEHSMPGPPGGRKRLTNDGILDWLAIEIAVEKLRPVRLTWVEKDIAVGILFSQGFGPQEAQDRTGARVAGSPNCRRSVAAQKIAEALNDGRTSPYPFDHVRALEGMAGDRELRGPLAD